MANKFGDLLREYRGKSFDPQRRRALTQGRLAEMLENTSGVSYTTAAVSEWERGKSQIHKDDRDVLVGLIQVLHQCGGIITLEEADTLLLAGHYSSLAGEEIKKALTGLRLPHPSLPEIDSLQVAHVAESEPTNRLSLEVAGSPLHGSKDTTVSWATSLHQLRAPVGDFIGRHSEIRHLVGSLSKSTIDNGAVTTIGAVRGMGGIGKTELAYAVAQQVLPRFPEAQIVLNLLGATETPLSPVQALQYVIRAFDPGAPLTDDIFQLQGRYRSLLHDKRVLILADDAYDVAQMRPLLPPPGCALLITSRHHFSLPNMLAINLEALPLGEAEQLLLSICPRIGQDASHIVMLCGRLPLALRVCGTLLENDPAFRIDEYIQLLEDSRLKLSYLRDPDDVALDVEAALTLSYTTLNQPAQSVLRQLSVFIGSFDEAAALAIVELSSVTSMRDIKSALGMLYRRSLLEYSNERYWLHDLVRAFALTRLESNEAQIVQTQHAQYYLQVAFNAEKLYQTGGKHLFAGLKLFDLERSQIDTGWAWVRQQATMGNNEADDLLLRYVQATVYIGEIRYQVEQERIPQLTDALQASIRLSNRNAEAWILSSLGMAYKNLGNIQRAIQYYENALTIFQELKNQQGESVVLGNLGTAYRYLGEFHAAVIYYEQQYRIAHTLFESGDKAFNTVRAMAFALGGLGRAHSRLGDTHRAIDYYQQQLVLNRELGNHRGESFALGGLGGVHIQLGNIEQAIAYYEQQHQIAVEIGDQYTAGHALGNLGIAYYKLNDIDRAIDHYRQQLAASRNYGDRRGQAGAHWNMGLALLKQGKYEEAVSLMHKCVDLEKEINHPVTAEHTQSLLNLQSNGNNSDSSRIFEQYNLEPISSNLG